jgi:hypothetical protein
MTSAVTAKVQGTSQMLSHLIVVATSSANKAIKKLFNCPDK